MKNTLALCALILGICFTTLAAAGDYQLGTLTIEQPWARASIGQAKTGAAYLTLNNGGDGIDRLLSVATPAAKHAALHTHLMEAGIMKMRPVEAIEVAPGAPTVLAPGGLHVMLMGLAAPLVEGESFTLTLTFEHAGAIEVEVRVQGIGAMEPAMEHKHGS